MPMADTAGGRLASGGREPVNDGVENPALLEYHRYGAGKPDQESA
jgi:hypothetical protein